MTCQAQRPPYAPQILTTYSDDSICLWVIQLILLGKAPIMMGHLSTGWMSREILAPHRMGFQGTNPTENDSPVSGVGNLTPYRGIPHDWRISGATVQCRLGLTARSCKGKHQYYKTQLKSTKINRIVCSLNSLNQNV